MRFLILLGLLYFIPTILGRNKADVMGIFLVNLLLGWTVVGWIVALIWALSPDKYVAIPGVPVSSGRFCSHCGAVSAAGAHFCAACGKAV